MRQPVNLVFATQLIDPGDPVLGFTVQLARALRERTANLVVVANQVGEVPVDLAGVVHTLGKERGAGKVARGLEYQRIVADALGHLRPATLLAHMCPPYLTVANPVVRLRRATSMLWYTHPTATTALGWAEWAADVVLTALPGSYPRPSSKVRAIGHSIDTGAFAVRPPRPGGDGLRLVGVGRFSPVKQYPVAIRAVRLARDQGADVHLRLVGPVSGDGDRRHRDQLLALTSQLGVAGEVTVTGDMAPSAVPDLLASADALVNTTTAGSADKVVFEAMACGRPVLVSSPAFAELVGGGPLRLRFEDGDADSLASAMVELAAATAETRQRAAALLRSRVERHHSLAHWADEVVGIAAELQHPTRPARTRRTVPWLAPSPVSEDF